MGSCGRLVKASPGKAVFFKDHAYKKLHPDRRGGRPSEGGVHRIRGQGGIPHLFIPLNYMLTHKKTAKIRKQYVPLRDPGIGSLCKGKNALWINCRSGDTDYHECVAF